MVDLAGPLTPPDNKCIYIFVCTGRVDVRIEWDERKASSNLKKHGVAFDDAVLVFEDPYHLSRQDRDENGEARWQSLGKVGGVVVLQVAHTYTAADGEEVIRIISARKATRQERDVYEQQAFQ